MTASSPGAKVVVTFDPSTALVIASFYEALTTILRAQAAQHALQVVGDGHSNDATPMLDFPLRAYAEDPGSLKGDVKVRYRANMSLVKPESMVALRSIKSIEITRDTFGSKGWRYVHQLEATVIAELQGWNFVLGIFGKAVEEYTFTIKITAHYGDEEKKHIEGKSVSIKLNLPEGEGEYFTVGGPG